MRVLHIDTGTSMRGGQWQALYLLQGLTQRGIGCRLLAPNGSPLLAAAVAANCDALPLRVSSLVRHASRFDLIHAHDARAHTLAFLTRKPLAVSRRVAFPVKHTLLSRLKYKRPSQFIAVSNYVRNVLIDAGVMPDRISVVYDGVLLPALARFEPRSGVIAIDSEDPGKGKAIVEEAARALGIPVHFSRDLPADLTNAALFVYITDLEGLGSAALLAMAQGVPVLASRTGGLPEAVEHGVTGLLTSNQPADVARGMKQLLDDRALAMQLGEQGRTAVEQRFTVDRMVEQTIRVYEKIAAC